MFSFGRNCFIFVFVIVTGCHACFRSNEHESISATTGGSFYKECECLEEDQSLSNLKWFDNHGQVVQPGLGTDSNIFTEKEGSSVNLHIKNINKDMSGTYKCVTEIYGKEYVHSYTIDAYDPLYFYQTPNNQFITHGQDSKILCQPKSDTSVIVSWQKEQDDPFEIASDDNKYRLETDGLLLKNVTKQDAGVYICQARVIATNEEVDKYIKVEVMTKPEILEVRANPDAVVNVGQNLTIDCIADGTPYPEYHWNKTGNLKETNNIDKVSWRQDLNTIIFEEIQADDSGNYSCYAKNEAGITEMSIYVDVMIPPQIIDFSNITENEGTTIQLMCVATGRPEPNISIAYIGNDAKNELIYYQTVPNMAFINLDRSHEGIYICNATNEVESIVRAMYLTVLHKPNFKTKEEYLWGWDGITVNLSCAHDSNPPALINWRYQGNDLTPEENIDINRKLISMNAEYIITVEVSNETDFGTYYCSAKNNLGEDTKRIIFNKGYKPDTINNANIIDLTATSVTFQIYGPEKVNGPNIIGYTAQYDEEKNYNITDIHINRTWSTTRPYKLDKLKPNTPYKVQFAAINVIGTGEWSEYLYFTTSDKSVPDPPMWDEEPIILTSNSHVLKWKAPDDNGEPIDSYTLRYCPDSDEKQCKVQKLSPTTTLEMSDLEFNTTYFLELVAHNSQGDSMSSNISVSVPTPDYLLKSSTTILSSGAITAIAIVMVILCLLLLDVLLLVWRRQGIIASCCYKKDNKRKVDALNSRDKKGLLPPTADLSRTDNGHKEFEYNKTTGVVTGKHSAV